MVFTRWIILLAILSVVVTIIAVAATGFVVDLLAKVTSSSGGAIVEIISEIIPAIIGGIVIFLFSYLYGKREMKKKKSSKTRLREKEKDFFSKIDDNSPF